MVIGIVDEEQQVLDNLSRIITGEHPEIKLAFCSRSVIGALDRLKSVHVDVLITGIGVADGEGAELCRRIRKEKHDTEIIVIAERVDRDGEAILSKYDVNKVILKPLNEEKVYEMLEYIRRTADMKKGEMELRRRVGSVELTNLLYTKIKDGDETAIREIVFPRDISYRSGGAIKSYEIFLINILCFFLNENGYEDVFEEDIFAEMLNLLTDEQRMNYVMEKYTFVMNLIKSREMNSLDDNRIVRAKRYIEEHYDNPELSCDFLAERSGVSARHLRRLFAKVYGTGVQEYIMNIRIEKAKKLLRETVLPIETVISRVGYNSPRYFRKLFKAQLGCTMSEYRANKEVENRI